MALPLMSDIEHPLNARLAHTRMKKDKVIARTASPVRTAMEALQVPQGGHAKEVATAHWERNLQMSTHAPPENTVHQLVSSERISVHHVTRGTTASSKVRRL